MAASPTEVDSEHDTTDVSQKAQSRSVALAGLTKRFGETVAVDEFSIEIEQGELFALLGPSGCGKTTTMRCLAGFETPTEGTVAIGGRDVTSLPPAGRDVGMVFQNYALFPHYDVYRNIAYGLLMDQLHSGGISNRMKAVGSLAFGRSAHRQQGIREQVEEALGLVDLRGYGSRKISELSGGQQQRVALARALIKRPSVLLLDEPLSNLDRKLRNQMRRTIRDIQQEVGITTLFVTHDQEEAMSMADRIALMRDGKVVQVATPAELYERPATLWAANFVGSSNVFEGQVVGDRLHTEIEISGGKLQSDDSWTGPGSQCVALIRPESVRIRTDVSSGTEAATNELRGTIHSMDFLGSSVEYEISTPVGRVSAQQPFSGETSLIDIGDEVVAHIPSSQVRVLQPETAQ